jgi:hypothetical protein
LAFKKLLALRGVKRGKGGNRGNQHLATATVAVANVEKLAAELGVAKRTAEHRLALADAYETLPLDLKRKVDKP